MTTAGIKGVCRYGANCNRKETCRFHHPDGSKKPCKFWARNGSCDIPNCTYDHSTSPSSTASESGDSKDGFAEAKDGPQSRPKSEFGNCERYNGLGDYTDCSFNNSCKFLHVLKGRTLVCLSHAGSGKCARPGRCTNVHLSTEERLKCSAGDLAKTRGHQDV